MKKIFAIISIFLLGSCSALKNIPREEIRYVVKDSTVLKIVDSIRYIPVERYVDVVPEYDTLKMETSLASSTAFVDTATHTLKGAIENKKGVEKRYKIVEKYVEKCDTTYIKVPVPVEVVKEKKYIPKFFWGTFVFTVLAVLVYAAKIYLKIKTGGIQLPKLR